MSDFLLSLKDVSLAFGGPPVLDRVSLSVSRGLRAALTGRNGEGKSTLMKVIAGMREADSGEIVRAPGLKVAYVGQDVSAIDGRSGGQSRRARLEEALLSQPDLLLLDEPTNHLDTEAIDWLEAMLKRMRDSAVLLVTHDRRFLRRVATSIFDLDRGELAGWPCDYTTFVKRKADLLADEAVYWERKSKKLREEEAWIRRGVKARTTRNEGRVAALKKLRAEFAARRARVGTATMRLDTAAPGGEPTSPLTSCAASASAYSDATARERRRFSTCSPDASRRRPVPSRPALASRWRSSTSCAGSSRTTSLSARTSRPTATRSSSEGCGSTSTRISPTSFSLPRG